MRHYSLAERPQSVSAVGPFRPKAEICDARHATVNRSAAYPGETLTKLQTRDIEFANARPAP